MAEKAAQADAWGGYVPKRIVLMGVSGSGKSSIGRAFAPLVQACYFDGDSFHPQSNIDKMTEGAALKDEDRWPWLKKVGETLASGDRRVIVSCSALKRIYRDCIRDVAGSGVVFVYLSGNRELLASRMSSRSGHFMPEFLLDSQYADLQPPEKDETSITVDVILPIEIVIRNIYEKLQSMIRLSVNTALL
ncbi:unnamed protein product [Chondrus crispus]|uniref:Gluconokinase n=1 Tax=Chondrus crispus TaxID=2769 RepID=R7Q9N7_CHOCR|nr:unnamed protein product [Chondrus crispus]CDF35257.1 unnamed protein product [Chondrus crispus]|eukprot:XP_005715076.1 unnamed protein product [Chondrus crispus]